jgi:hypothetical protein
MRCLCCRVIYSADSLATELASTCPMRSTKDRLTTIAQHNIPSQYIIMALDPPSPFLHFFSKCSRALYLFTRSDLKTIVLPVVCLPLIPIHPHNNFFQTVFAYLSASDITAERLLCAVLWTWLHLLQFCVSNQSLNPEEDAKNKPWRPIPSGIVSVVYARILRWILLYLCLSLSISLEAQWQGISLAIAFIAHNELHLHSHWLMRNACNAWGYASFNAGASAIAGAYHS